ncbi:acyl-CoA dehydrogenase family protein [Nocardia sp. alder85J]|uniref:acyl-CoA dehydrogenase family protein n=1 Tax=Nocardia sp. alder85J TaxID=2862949 RepID=UPI001CD64D20|nr:acyl-CoA dehydrogenase family protein [Nocardia sp. alder85J]MCX4095836.1 acyl-CoA dehydrogenase family protein [Nocardia sp. alder85J]
MRRDLFEPEHEAFRASFRAFLEAEFVPHLAAWAAAGLVPREMFAKAGDLGFTGMQTPEEYGGGGAGDFRFNVVISEEIAAAHLGGAGTGLGAHNDLVLPYLEDLTDTEQKRRWLPGAATGRLIAAVAMTEPGTGSDLSAIATSAVPTRVDGRDGYLVNGQKTFISNGINADLVVTVVRTDPADRHRGLSLLVVERGMSGFERGRNLDKLGQHAQDTAELFFDDVFVPVANRLGAEGEGFALLQRNLPQERLAIAVHATSCTRAVLDLTLEYVCGRKAFGKPIGSFQATRFALAELATELDLAQCFVDTCVLAHNAGRLSAVDAAKAKWWCTELQGRAADRCLQLHGGYGYMAEQPIARAYADARVTRIYGGTTEIMKEIVGRSLGL